MLWKTRSYHILTLAVYMLRAIWDWSTGTPVHIKAETTRSSL